MLTACVGVASGGMFTASRATAAPPAFDGHSPRFTFPFGPLTRDAAQVVSPGSGIRLRMVPPIHAVDDESIHVVEDGSGVRPRAVASTAPPVKQIRSSLPRMFVFRPLPRFACPVLFVHVSLPSGTRSKEACGSEQSGSDKEQTG